jgi:hypothetical protein
MIDRRVMTSRYLVLTIVAFVLTACVGDVALQDPRIGETVTCREDLKGFNPWSQTDACVSGYISQGWVTAGRDPGTPLDSE